MIKPHGCKSEYQDKRYGKGKRLFNRGQKRGSTFKEARCTVCGVKEAV